MVLSLSVSCGGAYLMIAHVLLQKHSYLWFRAIKSLSIWYALVYTNTKYTTSTNVHSLLNKIVRYLLWISFYSSTEVYLHWRTPLGNR